MLIAKQIIKYLNVLLKTTHRLHMLKYYNDGLANAEITGPKFTAVFNSRGGLSAAREHGV